MSTQQTARPAMVLPKPTGGSPAGHNDSLSGHTPSGTHAAPAAEGQNSPQAMDDAAPNECSPAGTPAARPTIQPAGITEDSTAGHDGSLGGQTVCDTQACLAAEGHTSLRAKQVAHTTDLSPAGDQAARLAILPVTPRTIPSAGHQNGRDHSTLNTQRAHVPATTLPGAQASIAAQSAPGTGDQTPPAAITCSASTTCTPLADPLLALAADVLGDLEKVRVANENRLRQLTRSTEDKDGEVRGFGLDESHPDVARLAALVGMLAEAEHKATLNLARLMRNHPLGPWVKSMKGVGEKQAARLLAAIGDPYVRPEIVREDGTLEPSRPRKVSELWALCGYHVIKVPVSGQPSHDTHEGLAADGTGIPAGHVHPDAQPECVGGEQDGGDPGHPRGGSQEATAGVAPKRARGTKANWSGAAKMRAFLVAESCIKQMDGHYRTVYDATRAKYADAVHATECIRCGPKGKPALPGSPLSDGHKHARALRAVAKEVLRDLWREAKRIHEQAPVSGQGCVGTHTAAAADGHDLPAGHGSLDTHACNASGEHNGEVTP